LPQARLALLFQSGAGALVALDGRPDDRHQFPRERPDPGFAGLAVGHSGRCMRLILAAVAILFAAAAAQGDEGAAEELDL
jgi:hypothetical protein